MRSQRKLLERLADIERTFRDPPIVRLSDDQVDLYAKLEYVNCVGSIKDKPAFWILKRAIERGEIGPGTTVIESSSGNLACSLASFCRLLGLKFIPVLDPNVPPLYEAYLNLNCPEIVKVQERDDTGGYLKTRLSVVHQMLEDDPTLFWTNQYENPDGMYAHYYLTGSEICRALPHLDYAFIAVSSAGTIAGVSRRLKEKYPRVSIVAVDMEGSVVFGRPAKQRRISGIGSSIAPPLLHRACIDDVVIVQESDAVFGCNELLRRHGLFVGGSSGASYSAIARYFQEHRNGHKPTVVFLCCDRGTAYLQSVFDECWPKEEARTEPHYALTGTV